VIRLLIVIADLLRSKIVDCAFEQSGYFVSILVLPNENKFDIQAVKRTGENSTFSHNIGKIFIADEYLYYDHWGMGYGHPWADWYDLKISLCVGNINDFVDRIIEIIKIITPQLSTMIN